LIDETTMIPASTLRWRRRNLPIGGGRYFRLLPYRWTRSGIERLNREERRPAVFDVHPWEIDPDPPRLHSSALGTLRHARNRDTTESRVHPCQFPERRCRSSWFPLPPLGQGRDLSVGGLYRDAERAHPGSPPVDPAATAGGRFLSLNASRCTAPVAQGLPMHGDARAIGVQSGTSKHATAHGTSVAVSGDS
jgi:uncharacterized protein DUF3473